MEKNFNFKECEQQINKKWLDCDMFRTNVHEDKKPYTIIMPPPNITSRLHIGHAFTLSIQDFITRFKRMQGYEALLLPGADHAAIATEVKVVEELKKQGIEKSSLTREQFLVHIEKWYDKYKAEIIEQIKRLGISCDWSKFAFTMDDNTTRAVKNVFKVLHDKGVIYRGERMINWCPNCQTALSDAEVAFSTQDRQIFDIKYQLADGENSHSRGDGGVDGIIVATTRPETMFGDSAVAINPNDKRYKHLIGKEVYIPLTERKIPIIADEYVDMKFGTGALKITPAHDHADNQIGIKHNLPAPKVIDESGRLIGKYCGEFAGLSVEAARIKVLEALKEQGLLLSQKNYSSNVGKCYRCAATVEPTISAQWFVAMKNLAEPCIKALNNGLTVLPKKYEKVYLHWLNNIKDWCISRQLLSGHRIPAYACEKCKTTVVAEVAPSHCTCGGKVLQDSDVLDTWFSSALWPFCTLNYLEKTPEFNYFYPTQTLVTAYDILFFWVIRMLFSGIEQTGKLPFDTVLLHGLVRDKNGLKMSKSLGNGIDPVDIIENYGTDVLRFSLIVATKLDRDPRYSIEKATAARNFINKIWNAVKFFIQMQEHSEVKIQSSKFKTIDKLNLSLSDKWILTKLNTIVKTTTRKYEKFDFGVAAADLQSFFWNDVCDWYLETCKTASNKETALQVLGYVIITFLKLINPIMPFVTEQIYCNELNLGTTLLYEKFPEENKSLNFAKDKKSFDRIIEVVQSIRSAKTDNRHLTAVILEMSVKDRATLGDAIFEKLCGVKVQFRECKKPNFVNLIAKAEFLIDAEAAKQAIQAKVKYLQAEIERSKKMLGNAGFVAKAPKELVASEQEKLKENQKLLESLA